MKRTGKFSNTGLCSIPSMILVTLLLSPWTAPTIADTHHTVDTIAEGLLAAEAKFTDLQLDYLKTSYTPETKRRRSVEAQYAEKILTTQNTTKRLKYLNRRVSTVDSHTNQTTLQKDDLVSFDGEATTVLDRLVDANKPMNASIYAGYKPELFPTLDRDPHTTIWFLGPRDLLGDLIKKNRDTFRIESESEIVNGILTVKLTGTIANGKATLKLWVSPEHNFLPMKRQIIRNQDGWLLSETLLSNLVKLPNGMWYPEAIQHGNPNPELAHIYSISRISIEPISEDFFSPQLPPNTHVYDDILKISYTTY